MIHNLQIMLETLTGGVVAHMSQWDGWAVLIAAALFGYRGAAIWMPIVVALIIDPLLYNSVAGLFHGRHIALSTVGVFTAFQIGVAYVAYFAGRLVSRFR